MQSLTVRSDVDPVKGIAWASAQILLQVNQQLQHARAIVIVECNCGHDKVVRRLAGVSAIARLIDIC
jgi:hypothetical protein